jgi:fumarate hydratase subunit alpha
MRKIKIKIIQNKIKESLIKANFILPDKILNFINKAYKECKGEEKYSLNLILKNCAIAKKEQYPLCQDTGLVEIFLFIGQNVCLDFSNTKYKTIYEAINDTVAEVYKEQYLRKSVVTPITRKNNGENIPAIVNIEFIKGNKIEFFVVPKGFGCENMSVVKMFNPTVEINDIIDFAVQTIKNAGPNPCPPIFLGIGLGGTVEKAVLLAKMASIGIDIKTNDKIENKIVSNMEKEILNKANKLNIGALGCGGKNSALNVKINTHPTHIAGLPVAITFSCWCNRFDRGKI